MQTMKRWQSSSRTLLLGRVLGLVGLVAGLVAGLGACAARGGAKVSLTTCNETTLTSAISSATPGTPLTFGCDGTIKLSSTLVISKNLTLDGGAHHVTLQGDGARRVLRVNNGITVTLNALTIARGGGLFNDGGTVHISNSTIANNTASDGGGKTARYGGGLYNIANSTARYGGAFYNGVYGAGCYNDGGTVTISNSGFFNNTASEEGGGFYNDGGTVTISNSTFVNNTAGYGGGLFNGSGMVSISNSTFDHNMASDEGGGLYNSAEGLGRPYNSDSITNISNSTFVNNVASDGNGGGLYNDYGWTSISNSTFANNQAAYGFGAGLFNSFHGSVIMSGSIVAGNGNGNNCRGKSGPSGLDQGYNLESGTDCGFTKASDLQNTDPQLASALAYTYGGGTTQTLTLRATSPAINHLPTSACAEQVFEHLSLVSHPLTADQRGFTRPQGAACDLGAVEFRVPTLSLPTPIMRGATSPAGAIVPFSATASDPDNAPSQLAIDCAPKTGSMFPIGTTTVTCTASVPAGTTGGSFSVVIWGAVDQIKNLIQQVNRFGLKLALQTNLDSQLQAVLNALQAGQTSVACKDLTSFISYVNSPNRLTVAQAGVLSGTAMEVRATLGCL